MGHDESKIDMNMFRGDASFINVWWQGHDG